MWLGGTSRQVWVVCGLADNLVGNRAVYKMQLMACRQFFESRLFAETQPTTTALTRGTRCAGLALVVALSPLSMNP